MRGTLQKLLLMVLMMGAGEISGQSLPDNSNRNSDPLFLKRGAADLAYIFSAPWRIARQNTWQLLAFSAVSAGLVLHFDEKIDEEYVLEREDAFYKPLHPLARVGNLYDKTGTAVYVAGAAVSFATAGLVFKDHKLLQTAGLITESALLTYLTVGILKPVLGRTRPFGDDGAREFNLFKLSGQEIYRSFPSGHTSSSFAVLTVITKQYPQWWVKLPAYFVGLSIAVQRMESRNHWASDVLVGGTIGYLIGSGMVNRRRNRDSGRVSHFQPFIGVRQLGLAYHF